MNERKFLAALTDCMLPPAEFTRAAHGVPQKYHETITVAYPALINEHLAARGDDGGWAGFASANPELLERAVLRESIDLCIVFPKPGAAGNRAVPSRFCTTI